MNESPKVEMDAALAKTTGARVFSPRTALILVLAVGLEVACSSGGGAGPGSDPGSGVGGSGPAETGGAGSGGSSSVPTGGTATGGAGGTAPSSSGNGGSVVPPSNAGGSAGTSAGAGGAARDASTGGPSADGSTAVADGSTARADGGSAGGRIDAGSPPVVGPITAPVPDTASKVPILRAPSNQYTVIGNYPYGPLTAQRLDVIYPNTAGPKGTQILPAVLMFHGGGWIHSYTNNAGSGKDHMTTFSDRFLAHGFMVCDAEYRVADGTPDGALAPAAVQDALLAAKWCWDHLDYFHGDRTRYVVTGASAGGHLALMVGMGTADANLGPTNPGDFQIAAIVDGYGIADVQAVLGGLALPWIPVSLPNRAAVVKEVNPMTYLRKDIPPIIVVQGENDSTAPVGDSRRMVAMLQADGADATMHEVLGAGHGFQAGAEWDDAEKAMFDWLTARGIGK